MDSKGATVVDDQIWNPDLGFDFFEYGFDRGRVGEIGFDCYICCFGDFLAGAS